MMLNKEPRAIVLATTFWNEPDKVKEAQEDDR